MSQSRECDYVFSTEFEFFWALSELTDCKHPHEERSNHTNKAKLATQNQRQRNTTIRVKRVNDDKNTHKAV